MFYSSLKFACSFPKFSCFLRFGARKSLSNSSISDKKPKFLNDDHLSIERKSKYLIGFVMSSAFLIAINPFTGYRDFYFYRIYKPIACLCKILTIYVPFSLTEFKNDEDYQKELSKRHTQAAEVLYKTCVLLGGLYVKMGQAMTNMNYIVPSEYISVLNNLKRFQTNVPFSQVEYDLRTTIGNDFKEHFSRLPFYSFASASIGIVYHARMNDAEKSPIVLKFQTSNIKKCLPTDILMAKLFFNTLARLTPYANFSQIIEKLESSLLQEIDFINEARNMEKCRKDISVFPFAYVPKVYPSFTSEELLTMEFIDGVEVRPHYLYTGEYNVKDVLSKIFDIFGYQIFVTGFVHADPHHSNILVRRKDDLSTEIVLIDHGLYARFDERDQKAFAKFLIAGLFEDVTKMKENAKLLGVEDYEILYTILFQRPFGFAGSSFSKSGSVEEMLQIFSSEKAKRISQLLVSIPDGFLLVLRNISTLVAINRDFGEPVDIYHSLMKWARETVEKHDGKLGLFERLKMFFYSLYVRLFLIKNSRQKLAIKQIAKENSIAFENIEL